MKTTTKWLLFFTLGFVVLGAVAFLGILSLGTAERRMFSETKQEIGGNRVDELLQRLQWGNIAFNTPEAVHLRQPEQIQLLLSTQQAVDELQKEITAKGGKDGAG